MKHALYSASASERWLNCPGSIALCYDAPNNSNEAAAEGTLCHHISEIILRDLSDTQDAYDYVGNVYYADDNGQVTEREANARWTFTFDDEKAEACNKYIEYVRGLPGTRFTEVRSNYSHLLGLDDGEGFGTSDTVMYDEAEERVYVVDAKFGRGYVNPEKNKQLTLYAAGVVDTLKALGFPVKTVRLIVVQPRVTNEPQFYDMTIDELEQALIQFRSAVAKSQAALIAYNPAEPLSIIRYLNPGESQCKWCPAKAGCPALKRLTQEVGVPEAVAGLSQASLSEEMGRLPLMEQYIAAVRTEVQRRLSVGEPVSGWKLVLGREGNRRWGDEEAAQAAVLDAIAGADLTPEDIKTQPKLLSAPQIEKLLKKHKVQFDLERYVVRNPARPTMTTFDDPRPAWVEGEKIVDEFPDLA